ncbi:phage tail protein [uncultured Celeribacter sp.]|uniref:TipJ family phage tail tip protein n=1 Tax=uncultured Celeribacter sp. TaxID=1303376 RepID=UPI002AA8A585|nr:phage tail protein [uncultured Celeribacter sp.]
MTAPLMKRETKIPDHIPVLAVPHFNPETGRIEKCLPHGYTLDEVVRSTLPGLSAEDLKQAQVWLCTRQGKDQIDATFWRHIKPRPGVQVIIRVTPGKDALKSVLSAVVAIAAAAAGAWVAGGLLGLSAGTAGYALVSAGVAIGVTALGNLLINALIPPTKADDETRNSYSISSTKNQIIPNGAVPVVLGKMRFAPPFAALPYTEIVGDDQYIRALFVIGEGQVEIDDIQIGQTSISEYDEFEIETRSGLDSDLPISLIPTQVLEETIGVELTRPLPRDDQGEVIGKDEAPYNPPPNFWDIQGIQPGETEADYTGWGQITPITRTTGRDASGATVIFNFPAGLVRYDDEGNKQNRKVGIRIDQRLITSDEWQVVKTVRITARKNWAFWRQHSWEFPTRGRWQVRCTMLSDETTDTKAQQRCNWAALQTRRPEYPLAYPRPLALLAMRIKATDQLNGALDEVTVLARRIIPDWDAETRTWITRATENPASIYRHVLQAPENVKASPDSEINLEKLQAWHEFCTEKGLTYNKVLASTDTLFGDVLSEIAAAGRATREHDGIKWSVVIDDPGDPDALVIDHISPRNSWSFKASRSYFHAPHAVIAKFNDADNDYKPAERVVRWPGYEGEIIETEAWEVPGKVYADEVWREIRRRQLETIYRPDTYQVTQDGVLRVATRGDHVMTSSGALSGDHEDALVLKVTGKLIEIDNVIQMADGVTYGIRFQHYEDDDDTIGTSVIRTLKSVDGDTDLLTVLGTGPLPAARSVIQIGPVAQTAYRQIVRGIERTADHCTITHLIDAAPVIDEELEATEVPEFSSRIGQELDWSDLIPPAPRFTSITSGVSKTGTTGLITYLITPGSGAVEASQLIVEYKKLGDAEWTEIVMYPADGGGEVEGYDTGDKVDFRAYAVSNFGRVGPYSATVSITVGEDDADIPAALDEEAITVTSLLGGAVIQLATGADTATKTVQLYRSSEAVLDREADAVGAPFAVSPQSSYSTTLGDTTREDLITGGTMDDAASWAVDAGWAVSGGVAQHTAGTSDAISQTMATITGKFYRIGFTVSAMTAGSLTPRLTGGSDRLGTAVTADGAYSDRIQAVTGNDTVGFLASSDFAGTLDDVVVYLETDACLAPGTHYVWLEPQNADGVPGAVAGPFSITII